MKTAYDIMTRAVASCPPDTPTWQAARLMRDLNIGDVLVVEGKSLVGIVTDRDLAVKALTSSMDTRNDTIGKYMTTDVVTGEPEWDLERVADVMAKHQIRRLPIAKTGELIGIVSLGDVALHNSNEEKVGRSLRDISESSPLRTPALPSSAWLGFGLAAMAATMAAVFFFTSTRSGKRLRKELKKADVQALALDALKQGREVVDQMPVRELAGNVGSALNQSRQAVSELDVRDMAQRGIDYAREQGKHWLPDGNMRQMAQQGIKSARKQSRKLMSDVDLRELAKKGKAYARVPGRGKRERRFVVWG